MNGSISEKEGKRKLYGRITSIPGIDKTLTKSGMSADAKATGDRINAVNRRIDNLDPHSASKVYYDNTASGLSASHVQAAIDELAAKVNALEGGVEE